MRVPTSALCPACKADRQPNRLVKELGSDELFCVDPRTSKTLHTFASIEDVDAYEPPLAYLEPESAPKKPKPPRTPKAEPAPVVEAPIENSAPEESVRELDPVPVAAAKVEEQVTHYYPSNDESKPPEKGTDTEEIHKIHTLFNNEPEKKVMKFTPPPARKAPGGVLILTVRIPDQHVSPLMVEAEVQKEAVQNYFQRMVEYALEARWLY